MPAKKTAARKTAAPRKTTAKKAAPKPQAKASPPRPAARPAPPADKPAEKMSPSGEVCPRCGTSKFGPEDRIRAEGNRTVRYTVLVCERGHTFARPRVR